MTLTLKEIPDLRCDSCIKSQGGNLLFASIWGRDTAAQELLAKITLGHNGTNNKLGLRNLQFTSHNGDIDAFLSNDIDYDKKITKVNHSQFGMLNHLFIFDKRVKKPCRKTNSTVLIFEKSVTESEIQNILFQSAKALSSVPILSHWKHEIISIASTYQMLTRNDSLGRELESYTLTVKDNHFASHISELIKDGILTL